MPICEPARDFAGIRFSDQRTLRVAAGAAEQSYQVAAAGRRLVALGGLRHGQPLAGRHLEFPAELDAEGIKARVGAAAAVDVRRSQPPRRNMPRLEFVAQSGADVPGNLVSV
jgi:hypothetical protein